MHETCLNNTFNIEYSTISRSKNAFDFPCDRYLDVIGRGLEDDPFPLIHEV